MSHSELKEFEVGVFATSPTEKRKSKIQAYTLWFNETWSDYRGTYLVHAENGMKAKNIAKERFIAGEKPDA